MFSFAFNKNNRTTHHDPTSDLEYVINNVFFALKEPVIVKEKHDRDPETALRTFIDPVYAAAYAYYEYVDDFHKHQWYHIAQMLGDLRCRCLSGEYLSQLCGMRPGAICAFPLLDERSMIIFRKRDHHTLYEWHKSYPKSFHDRGAQEAIGSYPDLTVEVPNEVLHDGEFQSELAKLLCYINSKHPASHKERNGNNAKYGPQLLNGILRAVGHPAEVTHITKRVACRQMGGIQNTWHRADEWFLIKVAIQSSLDRSLLGRATYKTFMLFFLLTLANYAANTSLPSDVFHSMSAKILRRFRKLGTSVPRWLSDAVMQTCSRLLDVLDNRYTRVQIAQRISPPWNPSQLNLIRDVQLSHLDRSDYPSLLNLFRGIQLPHLDCIEYPSQVNLPRDFQPESPDFSESPSQLSFPRRFQPSPPDYSEYPLQPIPMRDIHPLLPPRSDYFPSFLTDYHCRPLDDSFLRCPRGTPNDLLSLQGPFFERAYGRDPRVALCDVEWIVEQGIDDWIAYVSDVGQACIHLEELVEKCLSRVQHAFGTSVNRSRDPSHDPEHFSVALLTIIELWVALDKLVVESIPIFAGYSPEIPLDLCDRLLLRKTVNLHRFLRAHQYISARHAQSHLGSSMFFQQFTENSFPVRYCNSSPDVEDLRCRIHGNALPIEPLHTKVVLFELQCPVSFEAWRSSTIRILDFFCDWKLFDTDTDRIYLANTVPIFKVPGLQHYAVRHHRALISLANSSEKELLYVISDDHKSRKLPQEFKLRDLGRFTYEIPSGPYEQKYLTATTHTSNEVLSAQADCHMDLSLHEYIAFAHLRSGGSLQWMNILRELRSRSLNFRRPEVHLLFVQAATQLGPLADTGELIWHQELQDDSFCHALLDELESLFCDVGVGSSDGPVMGTITLITSLLTSGPSEAISERSFRLLRNVREKIFDWVNELLWDVTKSPTNEECCRLLWHLAATCRSTFDVDPIIMCKLLHSARDVEIALACALLMRALVPPNFPILGTPSYSRVLLERDRQLAHALKEVLRNAILADATNFGVDLAVCKSWPGYRPGTHQWQSMTDADFDWIVCKTAETGYRRSQLVQVNLLDGSTLVDGWRVGERLPSTITGHPVYRVIFGDQNFGVIPSDLPEMDFVTLFMISEHDVHFSLRDDRLVIRAQHKDTADILELIPQEQFWRDLPAFLIKGHAHWLNHSTHSIEIRHLEKLWEPSVDNWRINLASKPCRITKGKEYLVDIHSPTWFMVSRRLGCLDTSENLIITVSSASSHLDVSQSPPPPQLSVILPRYGLSFFVNKDGELESRDFNDMVCDENQCIGTLSGLVNRLVLCPKVQIVEDLFPRLIIIPEGKPTITFRDNQPLVMIIPPRYHPEDAWEVTVEAHRFKYHVYNVDGTLGCLTGISSLTSRLYLAFLHAITNNACRPDPLTGRTGMEEAISLTWLTGDSLKDDSSTVDCGGILPTSHIPDHLQLGMAIDKIGLDHPFRASSNIAWDAVLQETYLYPSEIVAQLPEEEQSNVQQNHTSLEDDLIYTVASVVDQWSLNAPIVNDLSSWAEAWGDTIVGNDPPSQLEALQSDPTVTPLRTKIYNILAIGGSTGDRETRRFQLLFSLPEMVYSSRNPQGTLLSTLIAFANHPHVHSENLPCFSEYNIWAGYHPEDRQIRRHLSAAYSGSGPSWNIDFDPEMQLLLRSWPSEKAVTASLDPDRFDLAVLDAGLQPLFSTWYRNLKLKEYLTRVCVNPTPLHPNSAPCALERSFDWRITLDQLLRQRPAPNVPQCHRLPHRRAGSNLNGIFSSDTAQLSQLISSLPAGSEASEFQKQYVARLRASARHVGVEEPTESAMKPGIETLVEHYVLCQSVYTEGMEIAKKALGPRTQIEQLLDRGGQWPRATPYILFRCLASTSPIKLPGNWKKCLILLALLALEVQRARRLLQFSVQNLEEEFFRELENEGGDGWIAAEHPDWLLIQLQGNFLIRRVQVDVAKEMMDPRSTKNTVIQVNMGEGKSSVIIPICAAALANTHQLVRVIVPKALKAQMLQLLANRLGGLVGMSIHHFSLSRSSPQPTVTTIREIMNKRGALVMTPGDILTLKLNCVDRAVCANIRANPSSVVQKWDYEQLLTERLLNSLTENTYVATVLGFMKGWVCTKKLTKNRDIKENHSKFQLESDHRKISRAVKELQSYFCLHARDILDESDEILHPRFQMIYTIGHPQHLEGFPGRWGITQRVLRLVNRHASTHSTLLPHGIQCDSVPGAFRSFPRMHIVQAESEKQFIPLIAEEVVRGRVVDLGIQFLPQRLQNAIYDFISLKDILPEVTRIVEEYARDTTSWDALLLLRGLLAENILLFALTGRRWRVDYGLDPSRTMLAVPYRAKDVPAARAEFGHPDLTIVLTCLSYYYGGLSEEQLRIAFEILLEQDDSLSDYAIWLEDCACGTSLDALLVDLNSLNIRSSTQWEQYIFPLFSWNQGAIDFYLSKVVFPKHAKEYPWKLSGSSWDIAEQRDRLVTGFSGTNDAQYLLPTSIHQDDPDYLHQTGTNARVLANILHVDNDHHIVTAHENGERWSTRDLLGTIVAQVPTIRVLLDVGAQVLDLSNRALAETWLDLTSVSDTAGAIYFDEADVLVILTRDGSVQPLLSSPLAQHLDRCVTYLDDVHTRGTDIKFPHGFRAAVTLGTKVTKDRLAQGCMRMRKLGHGHSVMFFVPPEVDCRIRSLRANDSQAITTTNILHWAIRETWSDIQRWAPHWAQQGMCHKSRHEALSRFFRDELKSEQLATSWLQPEIKSLAELYAPRTHPHTTPSLALDLDIRQRCKSLGVSSLPNACLDEEQEREVSREIERERQTVQPPNPTPATHFLHPDVVAFVRTGVLRLEPYSTAFRPVFTTLAHSSAAATGEPRVWSPYILATADFCRTILESGSFQARVDQYLRPVQWVLSGNTEGNDVLVLLSPFEADRLMPYIRLSDHVHLHLYAPRTTQRMTPSDDLKLYTVPPVPSDWTPPWALIDQLNVFAGQLYLRDYASYVRLCRFLGVHTEDLPNNEKTPILRNWFNIPGAFEPDIEATFDQSPLPFVMILLAIRNRGMPFAKSHMGSILRGQLLTEKDFQDPAPPIVHYGME